MTQIANRFAWSSRSKIDQIENVGDPLEFGDQTQSNSNHLRGIKMLHEIRALIESRSSFRIHPDGPTAIKTSDGASGGVLECVTSGSSGVPKIIRRSHRSWIASFEVNASLFDLSSGDTYAVFGSLSHSLSLYGVLEAVHIGADLCLLAGLRADRQLKALQKTPVTTLYVTPTQIENLITVADQNLRIESVKRIFIGGGALSTLLADKCKSIFPAADLSPFYGASETSFITMANSQSPEGSVGTAYRDVEISIREATGQVTNGIGEIWVRSPYLYIGYADPVASDTGHQDGFVTVGEFGSLDQAGNLFIKGRKSRMVTIADQNVFPDEIEQFLMTHYTAGPVAVVAVPDDKRGHRLAVVVAGQAYHADLDRALQLCRKALGAHHTPKYTFFIKDLPQLVSGKLDYNAIYAWIEDKQ